jgi:hypothetical protein
MILGLDDAERGREGGREEGRKGGREGGREGRKRRRRTRKEHLSHQTKSRDLARATIQRQRERD